MGKLWNQTLQIIDLKRLEINDTNILLALKVRGVLTEVVIISTPRTIIEAPEPRLKAWKEPGIFDLLWRGTGHIPVTVESLGGWRGLVRWPPWRRGVPIRGHAGH
jgi:hypothetical protein